MTQNTLIVTASKDPAPKWPIGHKKFKGIVRSSHDFFLTDDFTVSVHSSHKPVLKNDHQPPYS